MYKIIVNDTEIIPVEPGKDAAYKINGTTIYPDIVEIREGIFSVLLNNKSYNAELVRYDASEKLFYIQVNNNTYKVQVQDQYDQLLKELGLDSLRSTKASDLKAPMPGLVVEVSVTEGQEVKKGDKLVVLEAMKMENILKASADGIVKKIIVKKGNTVEKNEVLMLFS